ncbi:alpha/beta fold hydrolase [Peribacillus sp. SCS-26]|uniref:alpha/beta fold hydrolase n=1 Tax=Paraperibacillus marinus TaxID=3115295 RepID=UPI0039066869
MEKKEANALLYLHGGPGERCFDFSYHQGEVLGRNLYTVMLDQRGVCRSEAINESERFGLDDIIEDCESLRRCLGIRRWSVLGHSFGGFLALLYGAKYPDSVHKLIFEAPTFDFRLTAIALLKKTAELFGGQGRKDLQGECLRLAKSGSETRELVEGIWVSAGS